MGPCLAIEAEVLLRQGDFADSTVFEGAVAVWEVLMKMYGLVLAHRKRCARRQVACRFSMAPRVLG